MFVLLLPTTHFFPFGLFFPLFDHISKNPLYWMPYITFDAHSFLFFVQHFLAFVPIPNIKNEDAAESPYCVVSTL